MLARLVSAAASMILLVGCFGRTHVEGPGAEPPPLPPEAIPAPMPAPMPAPAEPLPDETDRPAPRILAAAVPVGEVEQPVEVPDGMVQLTVLVSNQSFTVDPVHLVAEVDGHIFLDREFLVEGQHSWWRYEIAVWPGDHVIRVATVDPAPEADVIVPLSVDADRRWVVVDFWAGGDEGDARFTAQVSNTPVAFA